MRRALVSTVILVAAFFLLWSEAWAQARTGAFMIEASAVQLVGAERAAGYAGIVSDPDAPIRWDVNIPPATGAAPGVLVYVSPRAQDELREGWRRVLATRNLIWISARESGNDAPRARRVLYALLALSALERESEIDWERVYIAGFSGGGHTASVAAAEFPALFRGGLYICGADWRQADDPTAIARMRGNRYVFLTGRGDPNRDETRRVFGRYRVEGVAALRLMDLSYLSHALPRTRDFERAIRFLDGDEER